MVGSSVSRVLLLLFWGITAQAQPVAGTPLPITMDALGGGGYDYKTGKATFREVTITQGKFRIRAFIANANGYVFDNSNWQFEGSVIIEAPDGTLSGDSASVRFLNDRIQSAELEGTPATFERKDVTRQVNGRARRIDYDFGPGTLKLTGDAWVSDGENEIMGSTLVYSIPEQRLLADAAEQGGKPVRITIQPRSVEEPQQ